ncbi:hypothetical protein GCM10020221_26810 [Streptomyces thioluteus]|uniref:Uncharacterized protein n=1 Tax=Streptomyces thioluteus TaxID=66431 RepID=A0ABN3WX53_STRTU
MTRCDTCAYLARREARRYRAPGQVCGRGTSERRLNAGPRTAHRTHTRQSCDVKPYVEGLARAAARDGSQRQPQGRHAPGGPGDGTGRHGTARGGTAGGGTAC